jgi:hypothetical protein
VSNQGRREQEHNPGRTNRDSEKPAGTAGRPDNTSTESWQPGGTDTNRRSNRDDDDEDSPLGNRNTFR